MTLLANGDSEYEDVSKTFLLFGDPAMALKVPIPRRPAGLAAEQEDQEIVSLSWQAATDANGDPVAGYNVYRKLGSEGTYVMVNSELIADTGFTDKNFAFGTRYNYVVRSVDTDGTESVDSESVSIVPSAAATSLSGTAPVTGDVGSGACFVSTATGSSTGTGYYVSVLFILIAVVGWLRIPIGARRLG